MQEMVQQKKGSRLGKGIKVLACIAAVYGAFVAFARYMADKDKEMEKGNYGSTEKKYLSFMNGKNIKISREPVEDIQIRAVMGGVELNLTEAYITKDMDITIKAVMSGVHIIVPPMVRVILDGTNAMGGFANMVPGYEDEDLPTIFVTADSVMGGIAIEMKKED